MPLPSGHRLGSYEIVSALGSGGMGDVYRARDARLGRDVALKVLPPEVVNEPGRLERFDREARAIAALNHPHIVTIYSTEEADGTRFLTMELVDGSTLGELITTSGIAVAKFFEIAIPLADALAAAHQKQITHRDLKPGNVMVSHDGRVKVLDFGLARVGGSDAGEQSLIATRAPITHQGMVVGTMPYMSPEQVEGRPLDARTDLFSLGVMFHELLSGERPFKGPSSAALMSSILRDTPPHLADHRSDLPDPLVRLVERLLEKRPDDRWQTARDVFNELRHVRKQVESGSTRSATSSRSIPALQNLSVAVLPFAVRGNDPDAEAMAAGLTDDITTSLAKFSGLSVTAAQTTRIYKDSPLDVRQIAERVNARYVISGNVRKAAATLRTTAQLIDARSGEQLWTENYDRQLGDLFTIQDDVTDHIVATLADKCGVLARSMVQALQSGPIQDLTSGQLLVHAWGFQHRPTPAMHAELRTEIENRLATDPHNAQLWADLANMYIVEHSLWCNPQPDPLGRALAAARRSIELDRFNQTGWLWLAVTQFHLHDKVAFEEARDRAIGINPRNSYNIAWMGNITTHAGDYERGSALTERSMQINPAHPGWLHFAVFTRHMAAEEFEQALYAARRANMRDFFWMHFAIAAACGHLGKHAEGNAAASEMVRLAPFLAEDGNLREFVTRWFWDPLMIERILDGLERVRSDKRSDGRSDDRSDGRSDHRSNAESKPPSSQAGTSAQGALTVAVLPFVARSSVDDAASMAEGLTEDITNGLSRFGYLRVLSRSSAERLAHSPADLQVRARYAVEGNVRRIGSTVRISVTLVDLQTSTNLWTRNYDREADAGPFLIQDEVSNAVVATIGDQTGVLMRAMAGAANRPLDQLLVTELVVRYHLYAEHFDPAEHARLRDALERALEREPNAAEGWACLAFAYQHEYSFGFNPRPDPIGRERRAAERARELDPNSQQAWIAMASVHGAARDREAMKHAVESAVSINPLNAELLALGAIFLSVAGEHDRALALVQQAMRLKPQHAGWYYFPLLNAAYARGDYEEALRSAKKINMPRMPLQHANIAAAAGHLGLEAEAKAALRALRDIDPHLADPEAARAVWAGWTWSESSISSLVDGLKKALQLETRSDSRSGIRPADPSIAVLPFNDLSEKKDQEWFCDGIAEEILSALSLLPGLRVAARASSFFFKGRSDDLRAIAEKLNVENVLEGSVRRAGDRVRITTQLSDAREGRQLWSERFDRELKDIFDVQDEIAHAIVNRLKVSLGAGERLVQKRTANMDAYELLLRGRTLVTKRGPAIGQAVDYFERAVALDPQLADAHAGVADAYRLLALYGFTHPSEALTKAQASVAKTLELAPNHPDALATLANLKHSYEWRFAEAQELTLRALAADPNHVRALAEGAITLITSSPDGPTADTAALVDARVARARSIDPLNAWVMSVEALIRYLTGRIDEAVDAAGHAVATDPENFTAHWSRVIALAASGRADDALDAAEDAFAIFGRHPSILAEVAAIYAQRGNIFTAESILHELNERAKTGFVGFVVRAAVAASAGYPDDARQLLEQAIAERDSFLTLYKLPSCRLLRADPACTALLTAKVFTAAAR